MVLLKKKNDNLMISSGDCLIICDLENLSDKFLKIPEPVLPQNLTKGQVAVLKKEIRNVTSFDFYNENGYTVVSTENKQVVVYDKHFNIVKNFIVNRAASKVRFTPSNDVLVADKTGDVYLYKLNSDNEKPQLLLGHLSVILDMTMSECGKYIITCDRDEKIRVSHFPNAYNIMSFCLGHREFVTRIKVVKNILVSASGDGTVRFWDFVKGEQVGLINTNDHVTDSNLMTAFAKRMDEEKVDVEVLPVMDMQVYGDGSKLYIAVSLYSYSDLQVYNTILSTLETSFVMNINVGSNLFSYHFSDVLYILSDKFSAFKLSDEKFVESSVPFLENLYDKFKELLKQNEDDSIIKLYKRKFDNVQEYLERKRQRLEAKIKL
ncbi:tRNA (guanine-N(7)-)-methyltransferase non-catalytic subunit wuho [Anoplophora glabripennis]|uniref:tRNA (guanine-N(7)-)-methyltransferase non-catalytic subunit wuho n=1 Tax=Anoplophora glabripennis TaxID=217634 RepID=UPI0008739AF0|nr:tRNA (guanine-N(7)-)-methyltransferase non-catalytic subunit wuho [Anoplophora glabripennis]